jgi:hypothetical protein
MSTVPQGGGEANTTFGSGVGMSTVPQAGGEVNTVPAVAWA